MARHLSAPRHAPVHRTAQEADPLVGDRAVPSALARASVGRVGGAEWCTPRPIRLLSCRESGTPAMSGGAGQGERLPPAGPLSEGGGWLVGRGCVVVRVVKAGFPPRSDTPGGVPGTRARCPGRAATRSLREPGHRARNPGTAELSDRGGTPPRPVVAGPGGAGAGRWWQEKARSEPIFGLPQPLEHGLISDVGRGGQPPTGTRQADRSPTTPLTRRRTMNTPLTVAELSHPIALELGGPGCRSPHATASRSWTTRPRSRTWTADNCTCPSGSTTPATCTSGAHSPPPTTRSAGASAIPSALT